MNSFLEQFLLTMPEIQRKKLEELLEIRRREGYILSEKELKAEFERLLAELNKREGKPTFQARLQSGRTNSASHNQNLDEIYFDLITLFSALEKIDKLAYDNHQLNRSLIREIMKKLYVLESQIERYKLILNSEEQNVEGIYEQFKVPQYTETDQEILNVLRTDRFGRPLSQEFTAEISSGELRLSSTASFNRLRSPTGGLIADIRVRNRVGPVTEHSQHPIRNAIDGSDTTFWAESILVDEPIIQDISDLWSHDYHDYPKEGAICELEILLNGITTVSEIQFDPYCMYPLEIVSIYGYELPDEHSRKYELVSPHHENEHQRSKSSIDVMTFQFPSVDISMLRILIRQKNYTRENFIVTRDEVNQMELWDQLSAFPPLPDQKQEIESMAVFNRRMREHGWEYYSNMIKQLASSGTQKSKDFLIRLSQAISAYGKEKNNPFIDYLKSLMNYRNSGQQEKEAIKVSKLHYLYGAYDIKVLGRRYHSQSIYISKPLPIQGNVKALTLTTTEKHHDIEVEQGDRARITDIEHYITFKKNPTQRDWKPILPINKLYVEGELLAGDDGQGSYPELKNMMVFKLRFPAISHETVTVRRDGIPLSANAYRVSDDLKKIGIRRNYYSPSSIYTVSYKPADSAYVAEINPEEIKPVQYINEKGQVGEFFETTDENYSIELSHTPFVYRDKLFNYDRIADRYSQNEAELKSSGFYYPLIVRVNGVEYHNITDYANQTFDRNVLQTAHEGRAFAHIGRRIYFPVPVFKDELKNITVEYYYLTSHIRLKSILRRNHAEHESVTPVLYDYKIKCLTFD